MFVALTYVLYTQCLYCTFRGSYRGSHYECCMSYASEYAQFCVVLCPLLKLMLVMVILNSHVALLLLQVAIIAI